MRDHSLLIGAILGGTLVAACLNDSFRDKCRQAIIGAGNEVNKQVASIMHEISGQPDTENKGQSNDGKQ